jgi:hypothetical protein
LINKDFYHVSAGKQACLVLDSSLTVAAALEVKLKSPDGLTITTKGVSPHEQEKKTEEKKPESQITGSVGWPRCPVSV